MGHFHIPFFCQESDLAFFAPAEDSSARLGCDRLVPNPGSVGQPRDGDTRTAYGLYDAETATFAHLRVP